jgi:hypothetical protein
MAEEFFHTQLEEAERIASQHHPEIWHVLPILIMFLCAAIKANGDDYHEYLRDLEAFVEESLSEEEAG